MGDHVFMCYAREDQDFVTKLALKLRERKINVWLDQWHISAGADWDMEVDKALYECSKFLIVLSPSSVSSNEVRGEWRTAIDENKPIIPILYQSCRIPRQLKLYQYVDFTSYDITDESILLSIENVLKNQGQELQIPVVQQHSKTFGDLPAGSPINELAKTVDEWVQDDYPGYMVEGLSEKQIAFIRHPRNKLNITDTNLLLFLMRAGLHYGGNWPLWISKCGNLDVLTDILLDALCQSYDRVRFRVLYALQYHNPDRLNQMMDKKINSIPNDIMSIVNKHVNSQTVLDYLKGIALSSDQRLASKASAVIKEIEQFGFILKN